MKKNYILVLFVFMLFVFMPLVNAQDYKAEDIANSFNKLSVVKKTNESHLVTWIANGKKDTLTITVKSKGNKDVDLKYTIKDNVIIGKFDEQLAMYGNFLSIYVADSIGVLSGYSEGDLELTLSNGYDTLTFEKDGIELVSSDEFVSFKMDLNKKIKLIDLSKIYITPNDLENYKNLLKTEEGTVQTRAGYVYLYKVEDDIYIGEKGKITENSYKSFLSVIEVLMDSKEIADYVSKKYKSFDKGNREFSGIEIETKLTKFDLEEDGIFMDDYEFVKISVDREDLYNSYNCKLNNVIFYLVLGVVALSLIFILLGLFFLKIKRKEK